MPHDRVPAGCTSYLQWIDTHFAGKLKGHHFSRYMVCQRDRLTAQQKRQLLVGLVVTAYNLAFTNVAEEFRRLGYTDPKCAQIRDVEYSFVPPVQSVEEIAYDQNTMDARIVSSTLEVNSPSPRPPSQGRAIPNRLRAPASADIRSWMVQQPATTQPAAPEQ